MSGSEMMSLGALLLSAGSLLVTLVLWRRSGPRIEGRLSSALIIDVEQPYGAMILEVVNTGRSATTIHSWSLKSRTSSAWLGRGDAERLTGPELPLKIDPETRASWTLDLYAAKRDLLTRHPNERHELVAWVEHGKLRTTLNGVQVVKPGPPGERWRWWRRMRHDLRSPGTLVYFTCPSKKWQDPEEVLICVQHCGLLPIPSVRLDWVTEAGTGSDERPSVGSVVARRRWLLPQQTWRLPMARLGVQPPGESWIRVRARSLAGDHREHRSGLPEFDDAPATSTEGLTHG